MRLPCPHAGEENSLCQPKFSSPPGEATKSSHAIALRVWEEVPSTNLVRALHCGCGCAGGIELVALDLTVTKDDDALGVGGNVGFVRDHRDGEPAIVELAQKIHDL